MEDLIDTTISQIKTEKRPRSKSEDSPVKGEKIEEKVKPKEPEVIEGESIVQEAKHLMTDFFDNEDFK